MNKTRTPVLDSAAVTARAISRIMRKDGFKMADSRGKGRVEGIYVRRVECSNLVIVGYHILCEVRDTPSAEEWDRREEALSEAYRYLSEKGYTGEVPAGWAVGIYIRCLGE